MLELYMKCLLFGLIVVCKFAGYSCFFPDPPAVLEPPDYEVGYQILREVAEPKSSTRVRGIGKCEGALYIFFNRPYVYIGEPNSNELVLNLETKQFMILWLDPMRVRGFKNNYQLFSEVCGRREYCEMFLDDVAFGIYPADGGCYMYVVDKHYGTNDFDHDIPVYDLMNQMNYLEEHDVNGVKGNAYSTCSPNEPHIRFMYAGRFELTEENCDYAIPAYSWSLDNCLEEVKKFKALMKMVKKQGEEGYLCVTADGSEFHSIIAERFGQLAISKEVRHLLHFGGCIDGYEYAVLFLDPKNKKSKLDLSGVYMVHLEFYDGPREYNWLQYKYRPYRFPGNDSIPPKITDLFNVDLKAPPDGTTKEREGTPASAVVVTSSMDANGQLVTGTVIRTVWPASHPSLAFILDAKILKRPEFVSAVAIISVVFFVFLCLICLCLVMKRKNSGEGRGRQRQSSTAGSSAAGSSAAGSSARGGSSAASSAKGGSSAASTAKGGSSAASTAKGGSSAASTVKGGSSAASSAKGDSSAGNSAKGDSSAGSSAKGGSSAASSAKGGSFAGSSAKGGSFAASSAKGGSFAGSSAKGGGSAASSAKGGGSAASSAKGGSFAGSSAKGGGSAASSAKGGGSGYARR